ncbi:MAG: type II toxin-antitoxin system RelE/ParE family toxin [Cyanobacteria bacterium P01_F01_bin.150]
MKRFILARDACRDLSNISDYFLERSVEAGDRFVEEFDKKCQYLVRFPYFGKSYSHIDPALRGLPLMGYIIFYQVMMMASRFYESSVAIVTSIKSLKSHSEVRSLLSTFNLQRSPPPSPIAINQNLQKLAFPQRQRNATRTGTGVFPRQYNKYIGMHWR